MNKFYIVTRHPGAVDWLLAQPVVASAPSGTEVRVWWHVGPAEMDALQPGDAVIGTLPVAMAAQICEAGAAFYSLDLPRLPAEWRGRELNTQEMAAAGAVITEYRVTRL